MGSVGLVFRCELRRRWASWLVLSFLVTVIGAAALSGFSANQRTDAAFPSFVKHYGFNAEVFDLKGIPTAIGRMKYVAAVAGGVYYFNGTNVRADGHFVPGTYVNVYGLPTSHLDSTIKLISGHWPTKPDDVLVGFSMQEQYGLHVGSRIEIPFYSPAQRQTVIDSNEPPRARGPNITFRVTGIEASLVDFPSATPSFSIYMSRAFNRVEGRDVVAVGYAQVRLDRGELDMPKFQPLINNSSNGGTFFAQDEDVGAAAIESSIHPQAIGWLLFGLFAALAGLALIAQALSRQSLVERESYPSLIAVGMRPRELFRLGMMRSALIGVVGAAGAVALAYALSPFTPVGEAGVASSSQGFVFDDSVYVLGGFAIALAVVLLAVYSCWRASQVRAVRSRDQRDTSYRSSAVATSIGKIGAPPSILIGVRNALEGGRGRTRVPVVTALIGTVLAVAALAATIIFGSSLSTLVATPRLYGSNWQVDLGNVPTKMLHPMITSLQHDSDVARVTFGQSGKYVDINGAPVQTVYVIDAKGPLVFSLIDGHHVRTTGEINVATSSLAAAHAHVGSTVRLSVINLKGKMLTEKSVVAGSVAIPPSFDIGGPGDGAVVLLSGLESLACSSTSQSNPCIEAINRKLAASNSWNVEIGVNAGAAGRRAAQRLERKYAPFVNIETLPTNLVNFGQAIDFPLLLGGTLALFGAAMLAHLLFVSVSRRRRQFALLRVLGMYRRQVAATLWWQSVTVSIVGVALGVPLGVAFGRAVWHEFAIKLGVVPVDVVSVGALFVLAGAIVVAAVAMSLIPSILATRVQPAEALRDVR
ncbi:MAG: ABC transporter permease [Acidimicrobiales bacterium]